MRLLFEGSVLQEVQALPPGPRALVRQALAALRGHDGDRPPGLDVKRLDRSAPHPYFRVRVGSYRIVYTRQAGAHRVLKVFHRSDGYGWLERLG